MFQINLITSSQGLFLFTTYKNNVTSCSEQLMNVILLLYIKVCKKLLGFQIIKISKWFKRSLKPGLHFQPSAPDFGIRFWEIGKFLIKKSGAENRAPKLEV